MLRNKYIILLLSVVILSSCRSSRVLYNPVEVEHLSQQLKIPINNDDKDMPLLAECSLWLGVPYRYGGNTKKGVDCSGLVHQVFKSVYDKNLERNTSAIYNKNIKKISKKNLKTGDLVFFKISSKSKDVDHVGIFLREGYFIHASTSKGVIVNNLSDTYYKKYWKKGGRIKD